MCDHFLAAYRKRFFVLALLLTILCTLPGLIKAIAISIKQVHK